MGESKLLLALFCNKILTKTERGVVVVVFSVPFGCVTLTVTLQHYSGGECGSYLQYWQYWLSVDKYAIQQNGPIITNNVKARDHVGFKNLQNDFWQRHQLTIV